MKSSIQPKHQPKRYALDSETDMNGINVAFIYDKYAKAKIPGVQLGGGIILYLNHLNNEHDHYDRKLDEFIQTEQHDYHQQNN